MSDLTITRAANGWILDYEADYGRVTEVIEEGADEPMGLGLLHAVREVLGLVGSRYDARRIRITVEPGDKYEDRSSLDADFHSGRENEGMHGDD